MADTYQAYLELIGSLRSSLEELTALEQQKTAAVRHSDLTALDGIMKQEQALALAFRGMQQAMDRLGLRGIPLSALAGHFPPELREQAEQAIQAVQGQFAAYQKSAGEARGYLEHSIQEVDAVIAGMGGVPAPAEGPGYAPPAPPELPKSMKTDFRA